MAMTRDARVKAGQRTAKATQKGTATTAASRRKSRK